MEYAAALAAIKGLENGAELASAVEGKIGALEAKNYEVIGEKRSAAQKAAALETAITSIGKSLGLEGDTESLIDQAPVKIKTIAESAATLATEKTALESRVTEAESKAEKLDRAGKWSEYAAKSGANPEVLERLLADRFGEISVNDAGAVLVGTVPIADFVAAAPELKAFAPALFPAAAPPETDSDTQRKQQLPGGAPKSTPESTSKTVLEDYTKKHFGGLKKLQEAG
jgi:hypothetical protein